MDSSRADIILTNPCGIAGLVVRDSLVKAGVRVEVMESPSARKDTPGYVRELKKRLAETGAKVVVPVFYPEVLAGLKDEFPDVQIPLESAEKIIRLDNKRSALNLAEELGIPQPKRFETIEEITDYPIVFRRCSGQGGDSVYFPRDEKALRNLLSTASDAVMTEYIDGYNVSVDALRWGDFFFAGSYKVLEPLGKGVSQKRISIEAPELVSTVRKIMDAVDYNGVCGVDFRVDKETGEALFLECNPRFSGGLVSQIESGFDIPALYWRLLNGETINPDEIEFRPGILTGRPVTL